MIHADLLEIIGEVSFMQENKRGSWLVSAMPRLI